MATNINTVIRDPNRLNTSFYLWDLYDASENARYPNGKYVPNVFDTVIDFENGSLKYYVRSVLDVPPYTFTLEPLAESTVGKDQDQNLLLGYGPLTESEVDRIFIDKSVSPNTLVIGNNTVTYGESASYVIVYRSDENGKQEIVSGYYDSNGELTSSRIPLVLAQTHQVTNITTKTPKTGYAIQPITHGERLYVVVYDNVGTTLSVNYYLASDSSVIREPTQVSKLIAGIELETPFLSDTETNVIECDLNLPVDDLNLRCKVTYTDGTFKRVDIDGTKVIVEGLGSYIATQLGQEKPILLFYTLSSDEVSNDLANGFTKTMTKEYIARTVEVNESYYVKLFVVPRWISAIYGYRLEYYLYDLNRKTVTDVTSYISYNANSQAYDGLAYNQVQRLSVGLSLQDVSSTYKNNYKHTQLINLTLIKKGGDAGLNTAYRIAYNIDATEYGDGLYAIRSNDGVNNWYDISCGIGLTEDWIERLYENTYPLYSPTGETKAPIPTHVRLLIHSTSTLIPVSEFGELRKLGDDTIAKVGDTIVLQWVRIVDNVTLELATSSLLVEVN